MKTAPGQSGSGWVVGSLLFLTLAGGVILYLWRQNAKLRSQLEAAPVHRAETERPRLVREGDRVPEFVARDTEGREVRVTARGEKTLLFIYDPKCDRCEAAMAGWLRLREKLNQLGARVQVVALSVADSYTTVQHARQSQLPFAPVPFPNVDLQKKYGVTQIPLTVVVDPDGSVAGVWDNPLDAGEVGDVLESVCPECIDRAIVVRSSTWKEGKSK